MNYKMILRLICYILRVEAVCLVPPLGISLFWGRGMPPWAPGSPSCCAGP